ncbi:MAG: UTP--glucose-1-phosphate uridylyltransferase GalU [Patescibacteria group bacterium]|nr:UTP--glucose-1-phosphate uridylyltransferase GalU [Patescibacteria group bacterium]
MRKVRKAVIPAAGFGTRFLPATKAMPKEMLPIIDKPMIHYAVEEAVKAGIRDIIFSTGRGKRSLEDYFDHSYELEDQLKKTGKKDLLKEIEDISDMAEIVYIRQKHALGLGHAILRAKDVIGDEPFAVILPDMLVDSDVPYMKQVIEAYEETNRSVLGVKETTPDKVSLYGIADPAESADTFKLKGVVEKPAPEDAPSNLYIFGRYVFTPELFDYLEKTKPTLGGEIMLTDAISDLIKSEGVYGKILEGTDFDTGDKLGYLQAMAWYGLKHNDLSEEFSKYLKEINQ